MAKHPTRGNEKKDVRIRRVRNLPAKPLSTDKAASVKGGDFTITKMTDKSSHTL